jgi:hypothetical protein
MTNGILRPPASEAPDAPPPAIQCLSLTEDEFVDRFQPVPNHLLATAGFDFGWGGCLFEASGPDLAFIRSQPMANVWTVIDGDECLEITDGMHVVNRLGYLLTEQPCPPDIMVSVPLGF